MIYHTPVVDYGYTAATVAPFGPMPHFAMWQLSAGGYSDYYAAPLYLPAAGLITRVVALTAGNHGGGAGAGHQTMPTIKPRIMLYRKDPLQGEIRELVAHSDDESEDVASYDAWHEMEIHTNEEILPGRTWWVEISAEGGANAHPLSWVIADLYVEMAAA